MQRQTRRFMASLPVASWLPRVEWSPDGVQGWRPATFLAGSVEADAGQQARWSCNLMLAGVDIGRGRDQFGLFGPRIRVSLGLVYDDGDVEWCGLGVYIVDGDVTRHRDGTVDVSGKSLEQVVIDDRFVRPRTFEPQPARGLVWRLLGESVPGVGLSWRVDDTLVLPKLIEERDRWGLLDGRTDDPSVARSLGARLFTDGRGQFVMAPVASLADDPVWAVTGGVDGVQVDVTDTISTTGVYNMVVARGVSQDKKPAPGPAVMADRDPNSPTFIGLRRKPRFYASPMLKNLAQCQQAALAMLNPSLGFAAQVNLTAVLNPALEVGDVITATMPDGSTQRHICDRISYDLGAATMSITGRQAASSLTGQPVDLSEMYGQDVDEGVGDIEAEG